MTRSLRKNDSVEKCMLVLACIGFGLFWSSGLFVRIDANTTSVFLHYTGRIVRILTCFVIALIARKRSVNHRTLARWAAILLAPSVLLHLLSLLFAGQSANALTVLASMFDGAAGAFITLLFAQVFSSFHLRYSQAAIPVGFMISHLLFVLFLSLSIDNLAMVSLAVMVAGSMLLYMSLRGLGWFSKTSSTASSPDECGEASQNSTSSGQGQGDAGWRIGNDGNAPGTQSSLLSFVKEYSVVLLGAVVFPLFYGIVAQSCTEANIHAGLFDFTAELITIIALAFMGLGGYFWQGRYRVEKLFVFVLPAFSTAFLIASNLLFLSGIVVKVATLLYHAAFWVFLARKSSGDPSRVYVYFGFSQGAAHLFAIAGRLLGHYAYGSLQGYDIFISAFLLAVWMLAFIAFELLPKRGKKDDGPRRAQAATELSPDAADNNLPLVPASDAYDPFKYKSLLFVKNYALSSREAEVFEHFVHGRSAKHIGKVLSISQNTVKTHLRNIYIKAGVSSKQELLDLVEQCSER